MSGAGFMTVIRRVEYGGKKGRAAKRRLNRGWVWTHPSGGVIRLGMPWNHRLAMTREPVKVDVG